ncbi:DEAD/DEAH box helicase [Ideonella sp. A 288]|uniref:DEAD/DEAH box helicase n=1 Tax=Ideonella sp. A 288 TaxID=1962181 RepID=UPI000B4B7F1E|nr:DEAD/DEAH box helicase [Ideonella sp. A 288]
MTDLPRTPPATPPLAAGFAPLGLSPGLVRAAAAAGWATPTAIQAQAVPAVLQGRDLLALAPTGSGKTAAFVLPLLQRLVSVPGLQNERPHRLRGLILSPTRELALQTAAAVRALAPDLVVRLAIGGVSVNPQMMALRGGAHLVLATPGRLLDLVERNALRLSDVATLVLDEADRLLELGFADELARVLALLPAQRQTLMFSATMPDAVAALADRLLRDPLRLRADEGRGDDPDGEQSERTADGPGAASGIVQRAIEVDTAGRTPLLRHLIAHGHWSRVLVFVATQYGAEHVADKLGRAGLKAAALHGQQSAGRRAQVLADFHARRLQVLVATDLAARGLDVAKLPVVVNYDLPRSAVDHAHRIGRTGRAGEPGLAVSFLCADAPGAEPHFRLIEKRQQQRVPRERVPGFEPAPRAMAPEGCASAPDPTAPAGADPHGGIKGHRKSRKDKLREAAAAAAARAARR